MALAAGGVEAASATAAAEHRAWPRVLRQGGVALVVCGARLGAVMASLCAQEGPSYLTLTLTLALALALALALTLTLRPGGHRRCRGGRQRTAARHLRRVRRGAFER